MQVQLPGPAAEDAANLPSSSASSPGTPDHPKAVRDLVAGLWTETTPLHAQPHGSSPSKLGVVHKVYVASSHGVYGIHSLQVRALVVQAAASTMPRAEGVNKHPPEAQPEVSSRWILEVSAQAWKEHTLETACRWHVAAALHVGPYPYPPKLHQYAT